MFGIVVDISFEIFPSVVVGDSSGDSWIHLCQHFLHTGGTFFLVVDLCLVGAVIYRVLGDNVNTLDGVCRSVYSLYAGVNIGLVIDDLGEGMNEGVTE